MGKPDIAIKISSFHDVYLAGPLFSEGQRTFLDQIAKKLELNGRTVMLPHRDGYEMVQMKGTSHRRKVKMIGDFDYGTVRRAPVILAVVDSNPVNGNGDVDSGTAAEIANAKKAGEIPHRRLFQAIPLVVAIRTILYPGYRTSS